MPKLPTTTPSWRPILAPEAGTVEAWRDEGEGDDRVVARLATATGSVDVPAPFEGRVDPRVPAGTEVARGEVLGHLVTEVPVRLLQRTSRAPAWLQLDPLPILMLPLFVVLVQQASDAWGRWVVGGSGAIPASQWLLGAGLGLSAASFGLSAWMMLRFLWPALPRPTSVRPALAAPLEGRPWRPLPLEGDRLASLASSEPTLGREQLEALARHPDGDVATAAAVRLAGSGLTDPLWALTLRPEFVVQARAYQALGPMGGPEDLETIAVRNLTAVPSMPEAGVGVGANSRADRRSALRSARLAERQLARRFRDKVGHARRAARAQLDAQRVAAAERRRSGQAVLPGSVGSPLDSGRQMVLDVALAVGLAGLAFVGASLLGYGLPISLTAALVAVCLSPALMLFGAGRALYASGRRRADDRLLLSSGHAERSPGQLGLPIEGDAAGALSPGDPSPSPPKPAQGEGPHRGRASSR